MNLKEQREKILSGQMYNDLTNELVKAREDADILQMNTMQAMENPQKNEKPS